MVLQIWLAQSRFARRQFALALPWPLCNTVLKHSIEVRGETRTQAAFGEPIEGGKDQRGAITRPGCRSLGRDAAVGIGMGDGSQLSVSDTAWRVVGALLRVRSHAAVRGVFQAVQHGLSLAGACNGLRWQFIELLIPPALLTSMSFRASGCVHSVKLPLQ